MTKQYETIGKHRGYVLVKAPAGYPGSKWSGGRYCYEHQLVWWLETGEVPSDDMVIHHINGDRSENRFENLELLTRSKHAKHHQADRGAQWVVLRCPSCKEVFERPRNQTHLVKDNKVSFCSRQCTGKASGGKYVEYQDNVIREYRKKKE